MGRFKQSYDVVVVGARCAGAATAFLLAHAGAKVLLIDRQTRGSDTMSTHALMRGGVLQLQRWGILPRIMAEGTPQIRRSAFHYGPDTVHVDIKPEHGVAHLCAPRRTVLDRILVGAAEAVGAEVRHSVVLSELQFDSSGRVIGAWLKHEEGDLSSVRSELVIGADGRQSTVAGLVAAEIYLERRASSGCVFGYFEGLRDDGLHWYFETGVAAGVIPTNHGQHCVFAAVPQQQFAATFRGDVEGGFARVLELCSRDLRGEVDAGRQVARLRGFAGGPSFLRQPHGPGWALVGDAGYFKDPLTAHGITDALRDAELLARAVLDGRARAMAGYQQERDALSIPLLEATDAIASFQWNLDEIKALHGQLSASMKAEANCMARLPTPVREAA